MNGSNSTRRLITALVDRLLEDPSADRARGVQPESADVQQLKRDVARDLEDLFNTRRWCEEIPLSSRELEESLVNYGLPDFTGLNMSAPQEREKARLELERAIRRFEPRLRDVIVTLQPSTDRADRTLRLRITGVLRTEPIAEPIVFDSDLEPSNGAIGITAVS